MIRASKPSRVVLSSTEQAALHWLLHATDNGEIISGAETAKVEALRALRPRLKPLAAAAIQNEIK